MYGFIYRVGWTKHNKWYIGSRYTVGCSIDDLWDVYFTSSRDTRRFSMIHGKPDVIELVEEINGSMSDILSREQEIIRLHNAIKASNYFNRNSKSGLSADDMDHIIACYNDSDLKKPSGSHKPLESANSLAAKYGCTRQRIYQIWDNHKR